MKYLPLIISFWLVMINAAHADNFEKILYNQNSGLEQSFIYTLLQDEYNYLWIGTQEGLFTYDGITFRKLKEGLVDDLVISSFMDSKGRLYFGHFNGSLSVYHNHDFDSIRLSDDLIQPIAFLEHGTVIYVLTRSHGIYAIEGTSVNHYTCNELNDKISVHFTFFNQKILISHHEGVIAFDPVDHTFSVPSFNNQFNDPFFLSSQRYDSGCWLWSEEKGLLKMNKDESITEVIKKDEIPLHPEFILEDDFGYLWLGSKTSGVIKLEPDPVSQQFELRNVLQEPQINSNKISCFYQDHEGNYWAGSLGGGLEYLSHQSVKNYKISHTGKLNAIIPFRNDQFIIGADNGVFYAFFDPACNEWKTKPTHWLPAGTSVSSLYQYQEKIFIGTHTRGIFTLNTDGSVHEMPFNHEFKKGTVRRIIQQDSTIYAAVSGQGFYQVTSYIQQYATSTGFLHNEIYDLYPDHKQQLWIGMHANGLSVKSADKFDHLTISEKMDARDINSIMQDEKENIWIATAGYGLYKYDTDFNLINHFVEDDILSNYGFFLLNQGEHMLLGSQKGIDRINIMNDSIEHIFSNSYSSNSLPTINGAAINQRGEIFILNSEGFQVIKNKPYKRATRGYKLLLTNFKIFNQATPVSEKLPGSSTVNINDYMKIKPGENHLNLEFLSISFANPGQVKYSFLLNDKYGQWSEPTNFNQVAYPSLNPGTYQLLVKSFNSPLSPEQYLTVNFTVPPPFYRQWWFIVVISSLLLASIYSVNYIKNRSIRTQNKKLEKLVEERTLELKEINDELLTTQEDVQQKNEQLIHLNNSLEGKVKQRTLELKETLIEYDTFLYQASHALKGPVARLIGLTSLVKIENPEYSVDNIKLFDFEHSRLTNILSKLTAVHTIFNCTLKREETSLLSIINSYFTNSKSPFSPVFSDNFQDKILGHPEIITIILENLLENAIMFSKSDHTRHQIKLTSQLINGHNQIEIFDNGIGIEKEVMPHIFKMYYRGSAASRGNGLGLYLVKKGLEKINGNIEVESEVMKFTIFRILLPA